MKYAFKNIALPDDAITQTFGFIGRKGSGKTYGSMKMAESFLIAKQQVIVLDPVGNWYGLRLDKTGKKASNFDIPVLGGNHGDIPLEHTSGKLVADFVLNTGSSAVIDVSMFRKNQRKVFVTDFAEELFFRQKSRRIPLHLFIEESQVFIPQRCAKGEERMLGALEDIVRLGRNYGIGVSLISQRPQSVNKEVLNQVEPLIVFQLVGAHERKAIQDWVSYAGANVKEQLNELAELKNGDCFFWSPAWVNNFKKTRFNKKITFDGSATPTSEVRQSVELKPVDLQKLEGAMQEVIDKAKDNDPEALKRKIKSLERELNKANKKANGYSEAEVQKKVKEALEGLSSRDSSTESLIKALNKIQVTAKNAVALLDTPSQTINKIESPSVFTRATAVTGGPQKRILDAIAWWESTGIEPPYSKVQVAFIASYKPGSGSFNNAVSSLRTAGKIEYPKPSTVALTALGRDEAEMPDSEVTTEALHLKIMMRLSGPQQRVLKPILDAYPEKIDKDDVAIASNYSFGSGSFNNAVSSLKTLGLIEYPQSGCVKALSILFLD